MTIPFIDLAAQQARLRGRLDAAIAKVLDHGQYVMGPEVRELEAQLAAFCGAGHALSCANGTDALQVALMALGIGQGDAVFVPAFTFAATAEAVPLVNATPVFVDVLGDTFDMDPESLKRSIVHARTLGLRPAAVIPVDLFGLPADYDSLEPVARENGLAIIADSAQGFGGTYKGRVAGSIGDIATTSFFPAKPLGCYGDGGAIFTNDDELAAAMDSIRLHGQGAHRYEHRRIGVNSRLDTLQAAILIEKLAIYAEEIELRQGVAARYSEALAEVAQVPFIPEDRTSIWAQYTLALSGRDARDGLQAHLKDAGIPTAIYYPIPLNRQEAYASFPCDPMGLLVSEDLSGRVLSIPMHPYLDAASQQRVIDAVLQGLRSEGTARPGFAA